MIMNKIIRFHFDITMLPYQYSKSHYKHKTTLRWSYRHNGNIIRKCGLYISKGPSTSKVSDRSCIKYSNLPDPPVADLYISMDQITSTELPADVGGLQGSLENTPSLVLNGVRGAALQLDGVDQAVNFGNLRHRCLGIVYLYICLSSLLFIFYCLIFSYPDIKMFYHHYSHCYH